MNIKVSLDDLTLVKKYRFDQDEESFNLLVKKYLPLIKYFANNVAYMMKTSCEQEDLIQLGIIALYDAVRTYDVDKSIQFKTYFTTVVKNKISNYLRMRKAEKNRITFTAISYDSGMNSDDLSIIETYVDKSCSTCPENLFRAKEMNRKVQKILKEIRPIDRKVYILWRKGYSYGEISDLCHLKMKKVDNILQKVKKILKD